jgi:hypothetical protein
MTRLERGYYTPKMLAQAARERLMGIEYDAERMRTGRWVVRPKGGVGTMGSLKGVLWEAFYTDAPTHALALQQALHRRAHGR